MFWSVVRPPSSSAYRPDDAPHASHGECCERRKDQCDDKDADERPHYLVALAAMPSVSRNSIGIGKTIVELLVAPISSSVWR